MTTPATRYPIEKHKHLYAKWCAAAYGRGLAGGGNSLAFELIEASDLGQASRDDASCEQSGLRLAWERRQPVRLRKLQGRLQGV